MLHINCFYIFESKIPVPMKRNYCITGLLTLLVLLISAASFAQDDIPVVRNANNDGRIPIEEKGFKKQNLFTGGNVTASFFSGGTALGANPIFGYKLNNYFDAGAVINYLYTGAKDYPVETSGGTVYAEKVRQHSYGPGVFMRAYPIPFLFAQAQLEQNFFHEKYVISGTNYISNYNAPSLLLGAGYASGRLKGGTTFFYMSLLFDVLKNVNSPYVRKNSNGTISMQPVIRAGFNIGLFQGRYGRYEEY